MGEVPRVSKIERSPSTRGTEALQSCFCRPGRLSMTTARRESSQIDFPSPRRSLWRLHPPARGGHPGPAKEKAKKKAEKKIEEVISRPCVCDEGCISPRVGRRSAREGRQDEARAARAGNTTGKVFHESRVTSHGLSRVTAFPVHRPSDISSGANQAPRPWFSRITSHETRITAFMFFTRHGSRNTKHGLCGRCVRRGCARVAPPKTAAWTAAPAARSLLSCALWRGMGRLWRGMGGILPLSQCPRSRPPFTLGLTASAVRRSSGRPAVCSRYGERKMNPC